MTIEQQFAIQYQTVKRFTFVPRQSNLDHVIQELGLVKNDSLCYSGWNGYQVVVYQNQYFGIYHYIDHCMGSDAVWVGYHNARDYPDIRSSLERNQIIKLVKRKSLTRQ